jgi:N-acetyl-anhydromuramyl-L-alanine amidase AmpD
MATGSAQSRLVTVKLRPRFWIPERKAANGDFINRYHEAHPILEVKVVVARAGKEFFNRTFKKGEGAHKAEQNVNTFSLDPFVADVKLKAQKGDATAAPGAGPFTLTITPGDRQKSFGAASPDSGFAVGPQVPGEEYETEYRAIDLELEFADTFVLKSVRVTGPVDADRAPAARVMLKTQKPGQLIDIDWRPDWIRRVHPAIRPKVGSRKGFPVTIVVLHQTGNNVNRLSDISFTTDGFFKISGEASGLGTHYIVDLDGHVLKLADEREATNHTNVSAWRGRDDIALHSIGIEHVHDRSQRGVFPDAQIRASLDLVKRIVNEHGIRPCDVVGHADVRCITTKEAAKSPDVGARKRLGGNVLNPNERKTCPGVRFEWARFEAAGLALSPVPAAAATANYAFFVADPALVLRFGSKGPNILELQRDLLDIGWPLSKSHPKPDFDRVTETAVLRFQARFLSHLTGLAEPDGRVNAATGLVIKRVIARLRALGLAVNTISP